MNSEVPISKPEFKQKVAHWRAAAGLDVDVLITLIFRGWSTVAGGASALLIPTFLSPEQQGYYYTFNAVLAMQIFFELGLNHVLTQLASHAAAHLSRPSARHVDEDAKWRYAIVSLVKLSSKWNSIMASLFFVTVLAGGIFFFYEKGSLSTSEWLLAWTFLVALTAVNLALSARLAICDGLGEVGEVARLRLAQSIVGYSLLWFLLLCHAGLWAAIALPLASAGITGWWLARRNIVKSLHLQANYAATEGGYTYRRDVFPLQWRIALSWASGYFIFNFLTPVVFAYQGAAAAGRLGLGLTIFTAISTIGMSWVSAKIPALSTHIARNERTELDVLFNRQAIRAIGATVLGSFGFLVFVQVAGQVLPTLLDRLPPSPALLMLAVATVTNTLIFSMAAYMRAHKEEPLLVQSIVMAILIGVGVFVMAHVGLVATIATYAAITVFVGMPWCAITFLRYRRISA